MSKLIFIAMPTAGSVWDGKIRPAVLKWLAKLHAENETYTFVAPMVQDYQILQYLDGFEPNWQTWGNHCKRLIRVADEVWVMPMPGWKQSVGVQAEITYANELDVPVTVLDIPAEINEALVAEWIANKS